MGVLSLFRVLEDNKNFLSIKYYSIKQTPLEQVWYLKGITTLFFLRPTPANLKTSQIILLEITISFISHHLSLQNSDKDGECEEPHLLCALHSR